MHTNIYSRIDVEAERKLFEAKYPLAVWDPILNGYTQKHFTYGLVTWLDRAALIQPKQQPVAQVDCSDDACWADILPDNEVKVGQLLYAAPPAPACQFEAACSGMRYTNPLAAGEVAAIWIDGVRYPVAAPAAQALSDSEIVIIANETHIAMPDDCDDQTEMLAIVHAVLAAHGIVATKEPS